MKGQINKFICSYGHETITRDLDNGKIPGSIGCKVYSCRSLAHSIDYGCPQDLQPEWEWYKPKNQSGLTMDEIDHVIQGGLLLRKIIIPENPRLVHTYLKPGAYVWHPVFLVGKVINHPGLTKCLVEFDFESVVFNIVPGNRIKLRKSKGEHIINCDNYLLFPRIMEVAELPEEIVNDLREKRPEIIIDEDHKPGTAPAIHKKF